MAQFRGYYAVLRWDASAEPPRWCVAWSQNSRWGSRGAIMHWILRLWQKDKEHIEFLRQEYPDEVWQVRRRLSRRSLYNDYPGLPQRWRWARRLVRRRRRVPPFA